MHGMLPLFVGLLGLALIGAAAAIVAGFGDRYRVGRLLAAAPEASIAEAAELAGEESQRYVRVQGRLVSAEVFPDDQDRPLVYRRSRLEVQQGGAWRTVDEQREAVEFGLEDRQAHIAIDAEALAEGLVVLPRIAVGSVADLPAGLVPPARLPADPATPARQRVEQVSAVEHATAAGVPRLDRGGQPMLSAGLGRPLILTTLERSEAMRILAAGRSGRLRAAAVMGALGLGLLAAAVLGAVAGFGGP